MISLTVERFESYRVDKPTDGQTNTQTDITENNSSLAD